MQVAGEIEPYISIKGPDTDEPFERKKLSELKAVELLRISLKTRDHLSRYAESI